MLLFLCINLTCFAWNKSNKYSSFVRVLFTLIYSNNEKARRLHAELCAEIESVDLVWYLVCVDLPFIDVT